MVGSLGHNTYSINILKLSNNVSDRNIKDSERNIAYSVYKEGKELWVHENNTKQSVHIT